MKRLFHIPPEFSAPLGRPTEELGVNGLPDSPVKCPDPSKFKYLFPDLHKDETNFLPPSVDTVNWLSKLGTSMCEKPGMKKKETQIPSVYTYFGQFIVHDISLVPDTGVTKLLENPVPLPFEVVDNLPNPRTGFLDLDSVYGPTLDDGGCSAVPVNDKEMMVVSRTTKPIGSGPPGTDIPRTAKPPHSPRIGDRRNDENLITSQFHLAWLRAHNLVIEASATFQQAQSLLRHRYQYLIVNDYLPKLIPDKYIVRAKEFADVYSPPIDDFFLPIEFSAACFRFGHSMIRPDYNYNKSHNPTRLRALFMPDALGRWHNLLEEWIIDWKEFLPNGENVARSFHPVVVEPLATLLEKTKNPFFSLAVRDLMRGYQLNLPTGQAVARALKLTPLTDAQIENVAINDEQRSILQESGFSRRTPLWFYLFAEAAHHEHGQGLGPVCGQLVAMVLLKVAELSKTTLSDDDWDPILGPKEGFDIAQFLQRVKPTLN
jgi:hypothetical protein